MRGDAKVWLHSQNLSLGPASVQVSRKRYDSRAESLRGRVLRGLAYTWPGGPSFLERWSFTFPWTDTNSLDDELFEFLSADDAVAGIAPWQRACEVFGGDSSTVAFFLARDIASRSSSIAGADLPGGSSGACEALYPIKVQLWSGTTWDTKTETTHYSFGTYDTATGRLPITWGTAPTQRWRIFYFPFFRCYLDSSESALTIRGRQKPRTLKYSEAD